MKKLLIPLACLTIISGCQEIVVSEDNSSGLTFTSTMEDFDSGTKTSLSENKFVHWSQDDAIALFNGLSLADKYLVDDSSVGTTQGRFTLSASNPDAGSANQIHSNVAVYPYQEKLVCNEVDNGDGIVYRVEGLFFPGNQQYAQDSFSEESFPMIAVTSSLESGNLSFRNIAGALKLQLCGTCKVKSISLEGNAGELLAGEVSVIASAGNVPQVYFAGEGFPTIVLDCGEGVQLSESYVTSFLISVPPICFEKGFTAVVTDTDGVEMPLKAYVSNEVERSTILVMPPLTIPLGEIEDDKPGISIVGETRFNDADVVVNFGDRDSYYGGVSRKALFNPTSIVENLYSLYEVPEGGKYIGTASLFANHGNFRELIHNTEYVIWTVPYVPGKTLYTTADILYTEFKTKAIVTSGGEAGLTLTSDDYDMSSISVNLSSDKAEYIYYQFVQDSQASNYSTDEAKISYLFKSGTKVHANEISAVQKGLSAGTKKHFWAVAVDSEGRAGAVFQKTYTTKSIVYTNAIDFYINEGACVMDKTEAQISIQLLKGSPVTYRYAYIKTSSSTWTGTYKSSLTALQEDMIINPMKFKSVSSLKEGYITLTGLEIDVEYIFAVIALDSEGRSTKAESFKFRTEMDLGNFVTKNSGGSLNPIWTATRPSVTLHKDKYDSAGDFGLVFFTITVPEGMTAYYLCVHPDYFSYYGINTAQGIVKAIYQKQKVVESGKEIGCYDAAPGYCVYVTWCDQAGNFYEADCVATGFN
ncbi:MAG: hypothetical protein ACI3ZN_03450 [Candidatus Cryptobacteroides sp.]